ncbi:MAG: hypothetical protein N3F66_09585 [Spirochaetes bacterium]|nr:hypothetical protein [Spirochaetota bacterium]
MIYTRIWIYVLIIVILFANGCKKEKIFEIEPNDTYTQANLINIGTSIDGYINTESDIDFYMADVQAPALFDISVSAVKGVNIAFTLWKATEDGIEPLKYVDDMRKSAPERLRGFKVVRGRYYISVSHGDKDPRIKNTENSYSLLVTQEDPESFESEPNDTILSANPIQIGVPMRGYYSPAFNKANTNAVNPNREEDWFTFYVDEAPVVCDIEVAGVTGIEAQLDIVDAQGNVLFSSNPQGQGVSQIAKGIGLPVVGNYYIMVAARNYAANNETPYSLIVTTRSYDNTTEIEPNNIMPSSTQVVNDTIMGRIYPDGDVDYYKYGGDSSDTTFYRVEVTPPMTLDVLFSIYNAKGEELYVINNDGTGHKELHPNCYISAPFYVKVWAKRGQLDMDNSYSLAIAPVTIPNLIDIEPNDTKEQANTSQGNTITGYISKKADTDYYLLHYKGRQKKYFMIKAPEKIPVSFSVTDSLGYILQTVKIKAGQSATINEIIDSKGYCIVKPLNDAYDGIYSIEIKDKP